MVLISSGGFYANPSFYFYLLLRYHTDQPVQAVSFMPRGTKQMVTNMIPPQRCLTIGADTVSSEGNQSAVGSEILYRLISPATAGAFRMHTRAGWLVARPNLRTEGGDAARGQGRRAVGGEAVEVDSSVWLLIATRTVSGRVSRRWRYWEGTGRRCVCFGGGWRLCCRGEDALEK